MLMLLRLAAAVLAAAAVGEMNPSPIGIHIKIAISSKLECSHLMGIFLSGLKLNANKIVMLPKTRKRNVRNSPKKNGVPS